MNNPKVSIIVPIYGIEKFIGNCVKSIINQDYDNMEVLLIDDCTPDKSISMVENIIAEYDENIDFKIIHHTMNKGQSGARNTGIRQATGQYMFFLDGDDELLPQAIKVLVSEAVSSCAEVTTANRKALDWETKKEYKMIEKDYCNLRTNSITEILNHQLHGTVWNKLISREFIVKNHLYFEEGIVYEDDLWVYKFICCQPYISFLSDFTYIYYIRSNSTMQTFAERHLLSKIKVAIEASKCLSSLEGDRKNYAYRMAENFRQGALTSCVVQAKDTRAYLAIYKHLRQIKLSKRFYLFIRGISLMAKLRFLNNVMPVSIGAVWNYIFIKLILWKWPYNMPYLKNEKLKLSDKFWSSLKPHVK